MATADREGVTTDPGGLSARLASADFVRLVARADGDGVAAAGTLARALAARGVPYQVATARTVEGRSARAEATAEATTLLVGSGPAPEGALQLSRGTGGEPLSARAWPVASDLLAETDAPTTPVATLALAGATAAGVAPGTGGTAALLEAVEPTRRPGVVTPTDPVDGLAHSTLVHGPFSGSPERVRETLGGAADLTAVDGDGADVEAAREVASATTLSALGAAGTTPTAAEAIERGLRPWVAGPLATLGGYADVLDAAARTSPGAAVALALGHDAREPALAAWREHGRRAHETIRSASTGRYDGLLAVRAEEPVPAATVARLVAAYRSPEPVVAVVTGERAALATRPDVEAPAPLDRVIRAATDGAADGTARRAFARLEAAASAEVVAELREALS